MSKVVIILIVLMALITAGALARGIYIMASGKDVSGRKSNQMMWYRVLFQGVAILLIFVLGLLVSKK
jgi:Hypoxia induced protein conserved region